MSARHRSQGRKGGGGGSRGAKDSTRPAGRGGASGPEDRGSAEDGAEPTLLRRVWDQVGPIAVAIVIALGIRAVVIESYYVPSGSMLPTMLIGDHVFVSKFTFGAHVPFAGWTLPAVRDPERGEIAVFALGRRATGEICPLDRCPDYPSEGFVKRIVGLPGDTVEYRDGQLWLNGSRVPHRDLGETFTDERGVVYRVLEEDLDGCVHRILDLPGRGGLTQTPYTVPPGHYFMMGDNRDNSNDSRGWGPVDRAHLKGPVLINYWAWDNQESWLAMLNPFTWVRLLWSRMHWSRIGMTYSCRGTPPAAPAGGASAP